VLLGVASTALILWIIVRLRRDIKRKTTYIITFVISGQRHILAVLDVVNPVHCRIHIPIQWHGVIAYVKKSFGAGGRGLATGCNPTTQASLVYLTGREAIYNNMWGIENPGSKQITCPSTYLPVGSKKAQITDVLNGDRLEVTFTKALVPENPLSKERNV
jgi:hypothetical protein